MKFWTNSRTVFDKNVKNIEREAKVKLHLDVLMPVAIKWYLSSVAGHSANELEFYIARWYNFGMKKFFCLPCLD
jgi:hypothetical protein